MQRCLDLSSVGYEDDYEYLLENIDSYDNFLVQLIERNHQRAIDFFTSQIEKKHNCFNSYFKRAYANELLERYFESLMDYDKAIELNPKFSIAYLRRGQVKEYLCLIGSQFF